jgi:hypothetical protein
VTEFGDLEIAGRSERRPGSLIRGLQHFPVRRRAARPMAVA